MTTRRFETYLAGSVLILAGFLLVFFRLGSVASTQLPAVFLIGIGIIFSFMAVLKSRAPAAYEMSPRTTLAYGVLAAVIGVLWVSLSIQAALAGYLLAALLIFFGIVFLAYKRIKPASA